MRGAHQKEITVKCKALLLVNTLCIGGSLLLSLKTPSSVSMCIATTPGITWCSALMCASVTPLSVQTLSTKRVTNRTTSVPASDTSCSSKPLSASKLSLSATLKKKLRWVNSGWFVYKTFVESPGTLSFCQKCRGQNRGQPPSHSEELLLAWNVVLLLPMYPTTISEHFGVLMYDTITLVRGITTYFSEAWMRVFTLLAFLLIIFTSHGHTLFCAWYFIMNDTTFTTKHMRASTCWWYYCLCFSPSIPLGGSFRVLLASRGTRMNTIRFA